MKGRLPRLIVNFKNYEEVSSREALDMIGILKECVSDRSVKIGVCVNAIDLKDCLRVGGENLKIYGQHVDPVKYGASTGKINPEYLKELGVEGSLVNHSEDRIGLWTIKKEVEQMAELDLVSLVCAESLEEGIVLADLLPDVLAYEPPELIGGDVSVATASPDVIEEIVKKVDVPVMVGAGIKSAKDVDICMELGAFGVLVASGVVKSSDPAKVVNEFLDVIEEYA